ncbi:nicotinamide riboside transporter PnuC [Helicobacter cholecystus]|uniref:nicotinamide riboside transporter PnuC n=1 Tax=Helicobacter cholecystus TaxID=45498 RepID=UPI00273A263D|nr:nicotinamide riboside transporter PnuC [Helicobacter cholecystus]
MEFLKLQFTNLSLRFYTLLFLTCSFVVMLSVLNHGGVLSIVVAVLGIIYVFFAGEGKFICFFFGIPYSLLYAYIAYENKLYGDMMLNILYLPINFAGIFMWKNHQNQAKTKITITSLNIKEIIFYSLLITFATYIYGMYLQSLNASFAYLNAFSVMAQLLSFYLQVKRYVQSYLLVTLANIATIIMWWLIYDTSKEQIAQLLNIIIFFIAGVYYYFVWRGEMKKQEVENQ